MACPRRGVERRLAQHLKLLKRKKLPPLQRVEKRRGPERAAKRILVLALRRTWLNRLRRCQRALYLLCWLRMRLRPVILFSRQRRNMGKSSRVACQREAHWNSGLISVRAILVLKSHLRLLRYWRTLLATILDSWQMS